MAAIFYSNKEETESKTLNYSDSRLLKPRSQQNAQAQVKHIPKLQGHTDC
jgi:hypothetical protein